MEMHAAPESRSSWTLAARKAKIAPQKKDLKDRAGRITRKAQYLTVEQRCYNGLEDVLKSNWDKSNFLPHMLQPWQKKSYVFGITRRSFKRNKENLEAGGIARWRNKIEALLDDQGSWIWDPANLRSLVVSFFTDLFAEENFNRDSFPVKGLFPLLHDSEKTVLLKDVDRKEITSAPFDMGAHKAPVLDGVQAHFFQSQWRPEGDGVYQFVQGYALANSAHPSGQRVNAAKTKAPILQGKRARESCMTRLTRAVQGMEGVGVGAFSRDSRADVMEIYHQDSIRAQQSNMGVIVGPGFWHGSDLSELVGVAAAF
ncbi:hypothetical protein NC651_005836 [Populus alba x Populus x berolinensis]|nr:hypothetical protein NC651_005836 [Populus alba x Populus x berolinensis]